MVAKARESLAVFAGTLSEKWPIAAIGLSLVVTAVWAGGLLWAFFTIVL